MRPGLLSVILLLTVSGVALGQTSPTATDTRLTHGRTISITDVRGQIITGRVVAVTPDVVTVKKTEHRVAVPFSEVVAIDEIDHLRNGVLVGLIVGRWSLRCGYLGLAS